MIDANQHKSTREKRINVFNYEASLRSSKKTIAEAQARKIVVSSTGNAMIEDRRMSSRLLARC